MGISDNAQRVSSPPIQREASHPFSNALSRTSVGLQSHCLPKPLTWEINVEKTQKNQKCSGTCWGRMQTTERQAVSLAGCEAGEQRVQQHSRLYTTAFQGCFPKLLRCLIESRSVIRTTALKVTQHMLQRQRVQVFTESLTAASTYTEPQLPGHTHFFTVTASPSLLSLEKLAHPGYLNI